jgi:predicted transcriptional regulator
MSKKRERLEIIYDILKAIQYKGKDVKPTHILYKSNISTAMLKEYLADLKRKKLIHISSDKKNKKIFNLTKKGHHYLQEYKIIQDFINSYGLD